MIRISHRTAILSLVAFAVVCVATGDVALSVVHDRAEQRADEAMRDRAELDARIALAPLITDEFLRHDATAIARMREVWTALARHGGAASLTVSTGGGRVVWSTDPSRFGDTSTRSAGTDNSVRSITFDSRRPLDSDRTLVPESELVAFETRLETAQRVPVVVSVAYPDQTSRHGTLIGDSVISAAIAAGLLLTTTTVVLYGLSGRNRSRRERSERQRLVQRLASTSDHERREIAGALHDGPVQDLVSVSLALATVATAAPPPLDTRLRELADTTRTAVTDVRALLSAIYPVPVPPDGWLAGITDLIEALRDAGVAVQVDVPAARYSASNELLMMRVSREALRNVSAHAHARSVSISVTHWGRLVHLAISDDGIGFDDVTGPTRTSAGHFGIQLVRDLACELGATLTIASAPGSGTVVGLELKEES